MIGCLVWIGLVCGVYGQGILSGSNTISFSVLGFEPFEIDLSNSVSLSYRIDRLFLSSQTEFSLAGLTSQDFHLRAPLGNSTIQGSLSFSSAEFIRAMLGLSGLWEGLAFVTSSTLSKGGSSQTPSVIFLNSSRVSGLIADLGRLTLNLDVGTTTSNFIRNCGLSFKRMRVSWGGLSFCGGIAQADFVFGEEGLEGETAGYDFPLPFCDFNATVNLRFLDLFEFQGFTVGVSGHISELSLTGNFAFDADYEFQRGAWLFSGPFLDGILSSSTTFDKTDLLTWDLRWSYQGRHCSLALASSLEIIAFNWRSLTFGLPSVFVDLSCDLICCGDAYLGSLAVGFGLTESGFEGIEASYSLSF